METNACSLLEIARELVELYSDSPFYAEVRQKSYDSIYNPLPGLPQIEIDLDGLSDLDDFPEIWENEVREANDSMQRQNAHRPQNRLEKLESIITEYVHHQNSLVLVDANQFDCFFDGVEEDNVMDYSSPQCLIFRLKEKTEEALFWTEKYFLNHPGDIAQVFLGVYTIESIRREAVCNWKKTNSSFLREIEQYKSDPGYAEEYIELEAELVAELRRYYSATRALLTNMRSNFYTLRDHGLYQRLKAAADCLGDRNGSNKGWDADGELIATKLGREILGQGPAVILTADKALQERERKLTAILKDVGKDFFEGYFNETRINDQKHL
jgi:hypothetical protein